MRSILPILSALAFTLVAPIAIRADDCPCVPISHLWIVKTCDSWDCASTELAVAAGDPHVFTVPYGIGDQRWLVLSLIPVGTGSPSPNDPFQVDQFDGMDGASAFYATIAPDRHPLVVSSSDGKFLVVSLKELPGPRHRLTARN